MTSNIKYLPTPCQQVIEDEGWDSESLIVHLLGFIRENVQDHEKKLSGYLHVIVEEEREMSRDFLDPD